MLVKLANVRVIENGYEQTGGEFYYPGNLRIDGDVNGEFTLAVDGNLTILGDVNHATLNVGGDLTVAGVARGSETAHFTVGGAAHLNSVSCVTVKTGADLITAGEITKARLIANGQITMISGEASDTSFFARRGVHLTALRSECSLTVGWHFAYYQQAEALAGNVKKFERQHQERLNDLGASLKKLVGPAAVGVRKKIAELMMERMAAAQSDEIKLNKMKQRLFYLEEQSGADAVPVIGCEKMIAPGCQISLQHVTEVVRDEIRGPLTLIPNPNDGKLIMRQAGIRQLQKP
jgi:uncharacterized protein (DUF342 family)